MAHRRLFFVPKIVQRLLLLYQTLNGRLNSIHCQTIKSKKMRFIKCVVSNQLFSVLQSYNANRGRPTASTNSRKFFFKL